MSYSMVELGDAKLFLQSVIEVFAQPDERIVEEDIHTDSIVLGRIHPDDAVVQPDLRISPNTSIWESPPMSIRRDRERTKETQASWSLGTGQSSKTNNGRTG